MEDMARPNGNTLRLHPRAPIHHLSHLTSQDPMSKCTAGLGLIVTDGENAPQRAALLTQSQRSLGQERKEESRESERQEAQLSLTMDLPLTSHDSKASFSPQALRGLLPGTLARARAR
ncbi:unnamed protein product [Pleuronectes platessa]|uniref:Uncharacterized protein n=1 Tax=Pleuronectes platessa TaxID=8262 RepID=A0A9N7TJS3_PLEPL|nr:unnamed protein product [Pleuronectes platessa]